MRKKLKTKLLATRLLILAVSILFNACNQKSLSGDIFNGSTHLPNVLYTETLEDKNGIQEASGVLTKYCIRSDKKEEIFSNFQAFRFPRMFSDNKKIVFLAYSDRKIPVFIILKRNEKERTIINYSKDLTIQDPMDGVSDIAVYDDTSFIFGYKDNLYKVSVLTGEKKILKNFSGKRLGSFVLSKSKNLLAFTYQLGFDAIKEERLGLYDLVRDSTKYFDITVHEMGNFSPSYKKLVYSDKPNSISILNLNTMQNYLLKNCTELDGITFYDGYFINDSTLIILDGDNEYLFDIESKSVIKKTKLGIFYDVSINY